MAQCRKCGHKTSGFEDFSMVIGGVGLMLFGILRRFGSFFDGPAAKRDVEPAKGYTKVCPSCGDPFEAR